MIGLAIKVQGLRGVKSLSVDQLAQRVPMERSYLWQIEHGKDTNIGRRILQGLAKALDVRIGYLVTDSLEENRSWEKIATDESLELFFEQNSLTEEEKDGLRKVSFRQGAPRSVREWEQFWDHLGAYSQNKRSTRTSRNKARLQKDVGFKKTT